MEFNSWINKHHNELKHVVGRITSNHPDSDELLQEVMLQLLEKPDKINMLPDEQKLYYFIRVVKNNWHSSTSPYQYHKQKIKSLHIPYDHNKGEKVLDEVYEENTPDMEWVYCELNQMEWFNRDLFRLWVELGTYTNVSKQTTIPLNSVGKYIKDTIKELNIRWDKQNKNLL